MSVEQLVKISLFLNLLLDNLRGGMHIETQCLSIGDAIWIANNDDGDTDAIATYLIEQGVSTADDLLRLVTRMAPAVASVRKCDVPGPPAKGGKPTKVSGQKYSATKNLKCSVFMDLCGFEVGSVCEMPVARSSSASSSTAVISVGNVQKYNIETSMIAVPLRGVVCISGDFVGDRSGHPCHAELKLLSALHRMQEALRLMPIRVAGCKPACNVCEKALAEASVRFGHGVLDFTGSSSLAVKRGGMTPRTAAKARGLDLEWDLPHMHRPEGFPQYADLPNSAKELVLGFL